MKYKSFILLILFLICNIGYGTAQNEDDLSKDIAIGLAELRADIFKRKEVYVNRINKNFAALDRSSLKEDDKKTTYDFIQQDIQVGAKFNSLELYDLLPKNSPYKNIFIEDYIAINQDYQIDKDFVAELILEGILTKDNKIDGSKLQVLRNDFEFLDFNKNDRVIIHNALGASYAILLGYCIEEIGLTIHNQYIEDHYLALDRIDRYPNINNGNLVEFLNTNDSRNLPKGEKWNKIIIRENRILEFPFGNLLNSLHDKLTEDGSLFILHQVYSDDSDCKGKLKIEKVLKISERADFKLIDKLKMDCYTYFKFKSVKE